ncbi:hypothetical protein KW800_00310 [Candidatus Parcubacteria bacterium]|nr:hypothetical protein [Candidatus Parcubacteria bacterium]
MDLSLFNWLKIGTLVLLIGGEANILLALFSKDMSPKFRLFRGTCGAVMLGYGIYIVMPYILARMHN